MTTNLLIGFNEIALKALNITSTNETSDLYPLRNFKSNNLGHKIDFDSDINTNVFTFDLGNDGTSDITESIDYIAFPAKFIDRNLGISIDVEYSTDNSSWTNIITLAATSFLSLTDSIHKHYFYKTNSTLSRRYYRVDISHSAASYGVLNKMFLGTMLDLGNDPDEIRFENKVYINNFRADFGNIINQQGFEPGFTFNMVWNDVSNSKVTEFQNLWGLQKEPLVYLYAQNNDHVINGETAIMANIIEYKLVREDRFNSINLTFKVAP